MSWAYCKVPHPQRGTLLDLPAACRDQNFLAPRGYFRALGASFRGLRGAFREEAAFRTELALAVPVVAMGLWLGRNGVERALLVGPMFLILVVELANSAIEATVDRIGYEHHELSGLAKDLGRPRCCAPSCCWA